jgi:glutamate 5-kinase
MELAGRRVNGGSVVECVDNDETAAVIASLVGAKTLILLTSTEASTSTATILPRW